MNLQSPHKFHIPVMGIGFTIDTPARVAHFGINSVVSIIEDHLIENMREVLSRQYGLAYVAIPAESNDSRARRITAYLDLLNVVVQLNTDKLKKEPFEPGNNIVRYFEMLPENSGLRQAYETMLLCGPEEKTIQQERLRDMIRPGEIDVNIMTKIDRTSYAADGTENGPEFSDAQSALRGFANSQLAASVVFSAGLNPRLYSYCASFPDFFPDENGQLKKKIVVKVSDYRSALIQGKFFAKKGLWVSEFRIESGLNCGGHAFATEGMLMGPILEEFKNKRAELYNELFTPCSAQAAAADHPFTAKPAMQITAQGGIGTGEENNFLINYYGLNTTGWGSPFLLVPEATNVDEATLNLLANARQEDYYLSNASPLGIPFNNIRGTSSEAQRLKRIEKKRPGSPCYKKFLSFNTEFTPRPICTASREYQNLKIRELEKQSLPKEKHEEALSSIIEKDCLCEGLGASALLVNKAKPSHGLTAVAVCPGPNLAYFSGIFKLQEMVDHIYGRKNILNSVKRPHVFVNELQMYISYLKKETEKHLNNFSEKKSGMLLSFRANLNEGINYYLSIVPLMSKIETVRQQLTEDLNHFKTQLGAMSFAAPIQA